MSHSWRTSPPNPDNEAWVALICSVSYCCQQFTVCRHLFYFSVFSTSENPVSACIQVGPSVLSHVSLFHDRIILKPRSIFFNATESRTGESSQVMMGMSVWACRGFNILLEEALAWQTPSLDARLNTPWCGSFWSVMFCVCGSFYGLDKYRGLLLWLTLLHLRLKARYFYFTDPVLIVVIMWAHLHI